MISESVLGQPPVNYRLKINIQHAITIQNLKQFILNT